MRYVITGASGHIGNNLIRTINALEPEAKIIALVRRKIERELSGTNCEQVQGDLLDESFLSENIREGDVVVHLACFIDLAGKSWAECYKVNYLLTKTLTDLCEKKRVKKFIFAGSVDGIYRTGKESVISEPEDYYPEKLAGNYGKTKAMAMAYLKHRIAENPAFNAAMVLPSAVIGVNDYKPSAVGKVLLGVLNGKAELGIPGGYNFVDVADVCNAIFTLFKTDRRGEYILSGHDVTVKELYMHVNRIMGWKKRPIIFPTFVAKLASPFVKMLNKETIRALNDPHNYSFEKAARELGYQPTPIEKTFENTVKWLDGHKKELLTAKKS
ncbi:MAG: NAD-dependent epimerase/dehydratase family protein [Clostridia bacterium]|nr:NAD-dependent epimerase/dehydratase family protein [Clostridia bacterium]